MGKKSNNPEKDRIKRAQEKAEDYILQQQFKDMIMSNEIEDLPYTTPPAIKKWLVRYADVNIVDKFLSREYPYVIVTCNAKPEYDDKPLDFFKVIEKSTSKKWIKDAVYVYEQRSKDPALKWFGLHTHILIDRAHKRESEIKREFQKSLLKVTNTDNAHCLNFRFIRKSDLQKVIGYLIGEKADEEKQKGQIVDKIMREKLAIPPYNEIGDILQIRNDSESESESEEDEEIEEEDKNPPTRKVKIPLPDLKLHGEISEDTEIIDC